MIQSFKGYCYTCYGFGHKANQCRSRMSERNNSQRNIICNNYRKTRHNAKFCRSKTTRKDELIKKKKLVKRIDADEVNKEMKNIWINKEENDDKRESIPLSGVDVSFGNQSQSYGLRGALMNIL